MPDPKLPTQVMVGVVCYQVTDDQDDWLRIEHQTMTKGHYGHTENRRAVIYLNPDQPESQKKLTLWHEVLHAVFSAGMGAPSWKGLGGKAFDREERVVRMLEAPTLNVLVAEDHAHVHVAVRAPLGRPLDRRRDAPHVDPISPRAPAPVGDVGFEPPRRRHG